MDTHSRGSDEMVLDEGESVAGMGIVAIVDKGCEGRWSALECPPYLAAQALDGIAIAFRKWLSASNQRRDHYPPPWGPVMNGAR